MSEIDVLLKSSVKRIGEYEHSIEGESSSEGDLSSLISSLTEAKEGLREYSLNLRKSEKIPIKSMIALNNAIEKMQKNPTTEAKINLVQAGLFGTKVPFWNLLKDIQLLLRVIRSLDDPRGKKTAKIDELL